MKFNKHNLFLLLIIILTFVPCNAMEKEEQKDIPTIFADQNRIAKIPAPYGKIPPEHKHGSSTNSINANQQHSNQNLSNLHINPELDTIRMTPIVEENRPGYKPGLPKISQIVIVPTQPYSQVIPKNASQITLPPNVETPLHSHFDISYTPELSENKKLSTYALTMHAMATNGTLPLPQTLSINAVQNLDEEARCKYITKDLHPQLTKQHQDAVKYYQETKSLEEQNEKSKKTISELELKLEKNSAKEVRKVPYDLNGKSIQIMTLSAFINNTLHTLVYHEDFESLRSSADKQLRDSKEEFKTFKDNTLDQFNRNKREQDELQLQLNKAKKLSCINPDDHKANKLITKVSFGSIDPKDRISATIHTTTIKYIVHTSLLEHRSVGEPSDAFIQLVPFNDFLAASIDRKNRLIELKKAEEKIVYLNGTIDTLNNKITDLQSTQSNNLKTNETLVKENKKYNLELTNQKETIANLQAKQTCANPNDHTNIADLTSQAKQLTRIKTAGRWLFGTTMAASLGAAACTWMTKNPNLIFNPLGFSTKY